MINSLRKFTFFFIISNLFMIVQGYAQDKNNLWAVGIGVTAVDYYPTNELDMGGLFNEIFNVGDHWNIYGPKINASRYLGNNLILDGAFSFNRISKLGNSHGHDLLYYAFDLNLQYNFLGSESKITPYLYGGVGYNYVEYFKGSGTLNMGLGVNYWFKNNWGANLQGGYKASNQSSDLLSHFYYALGVIYRFDSLNKKNKFSWRNCN